MSTKQLSLFDLDAPELQAVAENPFPVSIGYTPRQRRALTECLAALNSIPTINFGGCGISALAIYRFCKANNIPVGDRPFIFIWDDGDEWEADNNDRLLYSGEVDDVEAPAHAIIELYDGEYDSTGQCDYSGLFPIRQSYQLSEDELLNVINRDEWNTVFKRKKYVPRIAENLGIDLSDVLLEV